MTLRDKVATVDMVDLASVFNFYVEHERRFALRERRLAVQNQHQAQDLR